MEAIKRDFGSFENFKTEMSTKTVAVQGSGWGWLGYNKSAKRLQLVACPNQDPLQPTTGNTETCLHFVFGSYFCFYDVFDL